MITKTLKRGGTARVADDSLHLAGQLVTIIGHTDTNGPRMLKVETATGRSALLPADFLEPVGGMSDRQTPDTNALHVVRD